LILLFVNMLSIKKLKSSNHLDLKTSFKVLGITATSLSCGYLAAFNLAIPY
jgi:hypothetical protein